MNKSLPENKSERAKELAQLLWNYHHVPTMPLPQADLILGLGSYDIRVASYCAKLYHERYAPLILFSGKDGNWTKGVWKKTEAETFKDCAVDCKVPAEFILTENEATNIGENISRSRELLIQKGIQVKKIILVTKPNTLRRAVSTALKKWPEIEYAVSSPDLQLSDQVSERHGWEDIINEMVGDLQRIQLYPRLGYQTKQEIPKEVENAYHELRKMGFTKHLLKARSMLQKIRIKIQGFIKF